MGDYWSEEEIDRLEELRCEGLSFDEMAPHLGRSGRAVKAKYATLREHGEFDWEAKAKLGSAKLLSALRKHHGSDEVAIDVREESLEEVAPEAPEPVAEDIPDIPSAKPRPTVKGIREAVARHFNLRPSDIASHRRAQHITYPRHVAYFLCRTLTLHSYPDIGRRLGGKDHASIWHGCRKMEALVKTDPKVAEDIEAIKCTFDCENKTDDAS